MKLKSNRSAYSIIEVLLTILIIFFITQISLSLYHKNKKAKKEQVKLEARGTGMGKVSGIVVKTVDYKDSVDVFLNTESNVQYCYTIDKMKDRLYGLQKIADNSISNVYWSFKNGARINIDYYVLNREIKWVRKFEEAGK